MDDLPNVNNGSLKLDGQRLKRTLLQHGDYGVWMKMCVTGSADDFKKVSANGGTVGISSSIPSCTGLSCGIHVEKG